MNVSDKQRRRAVLLCSSTLAFMTMVSTAAAQTAPVARPQDPETTEVEEVVVTGSRIRRDPTTSATPLIQVKREDLLESGQATVIDYLATIPALSNSQVPSDTTGSLNLGGLSLPNLRTLGQPRTLTLVDGRRHVSSSLGNLSVDVDVIPRLLIQDVEIITGGASSVYGADAVSGVLNFILRKDFEGAEVDARYRQINQDGQASIDVAALVGHNFLDDRLNVYLFGEYEELDRVRPADMDWLADAWVMAGNDADPTATPYDGIYDSVLYRDVRTLSRVPWGLTVLANEQRASPTNDPDVARGTCSAAAGYADQGGSAVFGAPGSNCFNLEPGKTFVYEAGVPRQANFGTRISVTGLNRTLNVGGDGINPNTDFSGDTTTPASTSSRFQTGVNFALSDSVNVFGEAKYVNEDTDIISQPVFGDVIIANSMLIGTRATPTGALTYRAINTANEVQPIINSQTFMTRTDNAFLPTAVQQAILGNTYTPYGAPGASTPGAAGTPVAGAFARHRFFSNDRKQFNNRELKRFVVGGDGDLGDIGFIRDVDWDLAYTYGQMNNINREQGTDVLRFALAQDAVVDAAGVVNGRPGQIVCRAQLLSAQGRVVTDYRPSSQNQTTLAFDRDLRVTDPTAISQCQPLNVFGVGQQSPEALAYTFAEIALREENQQQSLTGALSGRAWDLLGAGEMGMAIGGEWRKEVASGIGRDADTAGRFLFLNTGADMPEVSYESKEVFSEVSLPLIRDHWLGDYAELSASYRYSDYDMFGSSDVYGMNLVYRPIQDITFKASFNSSFRVPTLFESHRGTAQTFSTISDPCDSRTISNLADRALATRRMENCRTLAVQYGFTNLTFDFADTNENDGTVRYLPNDQGLYGGGSIGGRNAGNPNLKPETSESFTFTVGLQPRFIPNFALVLDYYEIVIDDVITSVTAPTAAGLCVNGPGQGAPNALNQAFCDSIVRSSSNFIIRDFTQQSFNYAKRTTRGLDFTARYRLDTEEAFGHDFGRFNYSVRGAWLIEQKNFADFANPAAFTESAGQVFFPRVRMTSQLSWSPTDAITASWTVDWQSSQRVSVLGTATTPIAYTQDQVNNPDAYDPEYHFTGAFTRHDFNVRYDVTDAVTVSAGVTNAFDAEPSPWLGASLYSNFDPYGRRFNVGLNYRFQ